MSFKLGTTTLPTPRPGEFTMQEIETGGSITVLNGTLKKDIINRKFRYTFNYKLLSQTQVANILAEYDAQTTKTFSVSETNLTIGATTVHVEVTNREFNTQGNDYREDLTLILTEVV
jgi:hypothetical protein